MTMTGRATPQENRQQHPWDDRGLYRKVLAIVAPLPLLALGINYLLLDMPGDGPFPQIVAAAGRQERLLVVMSWVTLLFFALLIPAVLAVAAVTHRQAPRLTAAAMILTVPGFALGFATGPSDTQLALLSNEKHLDVPTITALDKAMWEAPTAGVSSLIFILGITFGLLLLGIALIRSRSTSRGFGLALALGGFTHPFMPTHTLAGVGLLVAATGFAGASLALLRMTNDEFSPRATAPRPAR